MTLEKFSILYKWKHIKDMSTQIFSSMIRWSTVFYCGYLIHSTWLKHSLIISNASCEVGFREKVPNSYIPILIYLFSYYDYFFNGIFYLLSYFDYFFKGIFHLDKYFYLLLSYLVTFFSILKAVMKGDNRTEWFLN